MAPATHIPKPSTPAATTAMEACSEITAFLQPRQIPGGFRPAPHVPVLLYIRVTVRQGAHAAQSWLGVVGGGRLATERDAEPVQRFCHLASGPVPISMRPARPTARTRSTQRYRFSAATIPVTHITMAAHLPTRRTEAWDRPAGTSYADLAFSKSTKASIEPSLSKRTKSSSSWWVKLST